MSTKHEIGGPQPPAAFMGKGTNKATVRLTWLRDNNEHLYLHEEVRLAKARLARMRNVYGPTYIWLKQEQKYLDEYEDRLQRYHHAHPETA